MGNKIGKYASSLDKAPKSAARKSGTGYAHRSNLMGDDGMKAHHDMGMVEGATATAKPAIAVTKNIKRKM